jgi:glucose/arabinose dehydrogenase
MVRRSTWSLGAALLAMACGACHPANPPANETAAAPAPAAAAAAPTTAAPATTASSPAPAAAPSPAAQPAPPAEEIAMAESKTAPPPEPGAGTAVPSDPSEVRRISLEQANALREAGTGVIVDVRDQGSYDMAHVKGAIHIAYADLAQHLAELPRDKPIVTYCA